jgi:hypothetical protein
MTIEIVALEFSYPKPWNGYRNKENINIDVHYSCLFIQETVIPNLIEFVRLLTEKMHEEIANSTVLWYDSVTIHGKLDWQDQLSQLNKYVSYLILDSTFLTDGNLCDHGYLKVSSNRLAN